MVPGREHSNYWTFSVAQVLQLLRSNRDGLSQDEVVIRQKEYGHNVIDTKSTVHIGSLLLAQFMNPLAAILICAVAVTLYLGEYIEAIVIGSAVGINAALGFYQEFKAETTIETLTKYIKHTCRVIRGGVIKTVDSSELVPGDIIDIIYGNKVSADARIIDSTNLGVDESILTGESLPVMKNSDIVTTSDLAGRSNYIFAGTHVVSGVGLAVVTATGEYTEIGSIAKSISRAKRVLTPVQNAVQQMSWYIFSIALVIVTVIFVLGISRGETLFDMLILSVAVAVGAVPEALPITMTVVLSAGVLAISKKGGLIRKLSAAETLGSTTVILTDKTGTLTRAELSLDAIYTPEHILALTADSNPVSSQVASTHYTDTLLTAAMNTHGYVEKIGSDKSSWIYTGDAFDKVILKSVYSLNLESRMELSEKRLVSPFNSTDKFSISISGNTLSIVGAPDILVKHSTSPATSHQQLIDALYILGQQGKRVLAVATKHLHDPQDISISDNVIMGFLVFSDSLRPDSAAAVARIRQQGVAVKIVTGDMPGTAVHIAQQIGIPAGEEHVMTGQQIGSLSDDEMKSAIINVNVFARVTPDDKLRIGRLYQDTGEIVAMTGDGVNDAPALRSMDIGISLASGSDVAKGSADMILLHNSFSTITETISEGYIIRANIQRAFVYLMSSSLDEVFVVAGALIAGLALPLNALQIIWVNMLTGTLPALAFVYETAYHPDRDRHIFNDRVKFLAIGIGAFTSILLFGLYYYLTIALPSIELAQSIFFVCFATYVLCISYSFRDLNRPIASYNPFSNQWLNAANVIGLALVFLTVYHPVMQRVFSTVAIPGEYIWIVVAWCLFNIIVIELSKYFLWKRS